MGIEIVNNKKNKEEKEKTSIDRTVRIPKSLDNEIKSFCNDMGGISVSSLIKMSLKYYMKNH